jgi:hypothetical protein
LARSFGHPESADIHHVIETFRRYVYPNVAFLSVGASKAGSTALDHRALYPDDVEGTVAASIGDGTWEHEPNAKPVPPPGTPECRTRLGEAEDLLLNRRDDIAPLVAGLEKDAHFTNPNIPFDRAYETEAWSCASSFWQYRGVKYCSEIPADSASAAIWAMFMHETCPPSYWSDERMDPDLPYHYQYYYELAGPSPPPRIWPPKGYEKVLRFPHTTFADTIPPSIGMPPFHPEVRRALLAKLRTAKRILYLNGEFDSIYTKAVDVSQATDSFAYVVPAANHYVKIQDLPQPERDDATKTVRRWAGLK